MTPAELRALVAGATKGPWMQAAGAPEYICNAGLWLASTMGTRGPQGEANAALIVAAVNELLPLLDQLDADKARIAKLEAALRPFAKMGKLLDGPFSPALFKDEQAIGMGGAWSENGEPRTITFGDLRAARAVLDDKAG